LICSYLLRALSEAVEADERITSTLLKDVRFVIIFVSGALATFPILVNDPSWLQNVKV
jgi:hypothetical protein